MVGVAIEMPERLGFTTEPLICINHINYGNHLDNSALLSLISEARRRPTHGPLLALGACAI